jgi:hypothetical protein
MDQFVDNFKYLISKYNVDNEPDTIDTMECVFEELDKPFTENEIENCIKGLNRNKSPGALLVLIQSFQFIFQTFVLLFF